MYFVLLFGTPQSARETVSFLTHHNRHVKHCHLTLYSEKKREKKPRSPKDDCRCFGACSGLDKETVGDMLKTTANTALTAIECVAEEREFSAEEISIQVSGVKDRVKQLVSWCFEPSQPQRITSGLRVKQGILRRQSKNGHFQKTVHDTRNDNASLYC